MRSIALLCTALLATLPATALAQEPASVCPWPGVGSDPASIGIERLLCRGGECEINLRDEGGLFHRFTTEPVLQRLTPEAPPALRAGDVLVAVDGALITTQEGGRRLARLQVGVPANLRLRRGGRETEVRVVPRPGCPIGALSVRIRGREGG